MNHFENFEDGQHVRLRSRELGTYLHADKDGLGVSLRRRRTSMKAVWAVHIYSYNFDRSPRVVLLHSAAYGRYLASMGHRGLSVEQCNYEPREAQAIMWQAVRIGSEGDIQLRHAGGLCLSANRRPGHRNDGVSVGDIDSVSTMKHWVVERIPARQVAPRLPSPTWFRLPEIFSLVMPKPPSRVIQYVETGANEPNPNPTFVFYGKSVFRLRKELASRVDPAMDAANLVMCVRAGIRGRRTPLVVNLPRNEETLYIVVFHARTPACAQLRYPDVNAG